MTDEKRELPEVQAEVMHEMIFKMISTLLVPAFRQMGMRQLFLPHALALSARMFALVVAITAGDMEEKDPVEIYDMYKHDLKIVLDGPILDQLEEIRKSIESGDIVDFDPKRPSGVMYVRGDDAAMLNKMVQGMQDGNLMDVVADIAKSGEAAGQVVQAALAATKGARKG